jgi:hypothetical protein
MIGVGSQIYFRTLFNMMVWDLASSTGSNAKKLSKIYNNYLYKIDYQNDVVYIPNIAKDNFLRLGKIMDKAANQAIKENKLAIEKYGFLPESSNYSFILKTMTSHQSSKAIELIIQIAKDIWLENI